MVFVLPLALLVVIERASVEIRRSFGVPVALKLEQVQRASLDKGGQHAPSWLGRRWRRHHQSRTRGDESRPACDDQGMDRGPSWLYHRVPENTSKGVSEVWRDFAHEAGDPAWGSEEIRGGDGTVFRRLRLTTEIVRNPLGSEGVKITYGALSARG